MVGEENTLRYGRVAHVDNKHAPVMFFFHLPPHKSDIKAGKINSQSLGAVILRPAEKNEPSPGKVPLQIRQ